MNGPVGQYLFESSWETCNKVGGIYTVIKSKAALMTAAYPNYFLIGPYFEDHARMELEKKEPPQFMKRAFDRIAAQGIVCHFGTWQVKGEPNAILIDSRALLSQKDAIKTTLWEHYRVESLFSHWDFEEPMIWSWAVGMLLEAVVAELPGEKVVAHFHEWLAGIACLYTDLKRLPIATVFTTHATMLGRALCGSGRDLYAELDTLNPYEEAKRVGVMDKFTTERACAHTAKAFTTVSEITGMEAEKILGKKPDVLVLNGLDLSKFPTFEEASIRHIANRDRMREFLTYYFFPYYHFDLDHNLIFSLFGRYEFRNKGIDLFIKALGELNRMLRDHAAERTVTAFFFVPAGISSVNTEVLTNKIFYRHIKDYVMRNADQIDRMIISNLVSDKPLANEDLFSKEFLSNNKKHIMMFHRKGLPPLSTHNLTEGNSDQIISAFRREGLLNRAEDPVKVVFYPVYLNGVDGLLDMDYYNVISGSHLGVFPSYYEPWGYTPLESAALGVPAVTTDLAGFGRFIQKDPRVNHAGLFVLQRYEHDDAEVAGKFATLLFNFARLSRPERAKHKIEAMQLSELADWKELVYNYYEAHNLALSRVH